MRTSTAHEDDASPSEPATAIFDLLPSSLREGLLTHLESADAPMAAAIRKTLVTFEQLPDRLSESAVAALFRTVDREVLLQALKQGESTSPSTVDFLLANIAKRMAEQYREDLAALPSPSTEEGDAAQRKLIAAVKQLARSGEIKLKQIR
ncbi:MAG: FliG C-terminal domain-containing protein [Parvularculaceae bacterium]